MSAAVFKTNNDTAVLRCCIRQFGGAGVADNVRAGAEGWTFPSWEAGHLESHGREPAPPERPATRRATRRATQVL